MKPAALLIAAALTLANHPAPAMTPDADALLGGVWANPDRSIEVAVRQCGPALCGTVVQASPVAIADARDSGYAQLVGMQLMRGFRPAGPRQWTGSVFVPDLGHSFSSHIELIDRAHVRVAGCLLGRFVCQSQVWQRA